jgi:hypothetical protein
MLGFKLFQKAGWHFLLELDCNKGNKLRLKHISTLVKFELIKNVLQDKVLVLQLLNIFFSLQQVCQSNLAGVGHDNV